MKKGITDPVRTCLTITVGFILIYKMTQAPVFFWIAFTTGLGSLLSDNISRGIHFVWLKLASLLSMIVPNVLLSVFFYFILFPIALLARLFGKRDPLMLKNRTTSVFKNHAGKFERASLEKPW